MESLAGEHHACFDQLFVELAHLAKQLLAGHYTGLGFLTRFDDDHDSYMRTCVVKNEVGRMNGADCRGSRRLVAPECFLEFVDAEFLHFHHGLKDALRALWIGIADHLAKDGRYDMPPGRICS